MASRAGAFPTPGCSTRPSGAEGGGGVESLVGLTESRCPRARGSARDLLAVLEPAREVVILPHDNPDPDSLASAEGLRAAIRHALRKPVASALSGIIGRSQNRAMVSRHDGKPDCGPAAAREPAARIGPALARNSHHVPTADAHLRTLARDFGVRLLDVPTGTPPGPNPEISRQSTNLRALATRRGEKSGLEQERPDAHEVASGLPGKGILGFLRGRWSSRSECVAPG